MACTAITVMTVMPAIKTVINFHTLPPMTQQRRDPSAAEVQTQACQPAEAETQAYQPAETETQAFQPAETDSSLPIN